MEIIRTLKTKGHQFDNFVVIDGTISCRYDNLRCHQWRQRCQIDNLLFLSEYSNKRLLPSVVLWLAHCINITLLGCCRLTLWMLLLQEIDEFERGLSWVDHNIRHHPYSSSIVKRQEFDDQRGLFYKRSLHFGIKNLKQCLRMNTYSKWKHAKSFCRFEGNRVAQKFNCLSSPWSISWVCYVQLCNHLDDCTLQVPRSHAAGTVLYLQVPSP